MAELARDLMGDRFMLAAPAEGERGSGPERWNNQYLGSLGVAIAGGASTSSATSSPNAASGCRAIP